MIKKGLSPVFLTFLTSDDKENTLKNKVIKIVQTLAEFAKTEIKIYFIHHDPNLNLFKENCERKLTCILCKRLMIRIAKEIGKIEGTNVIVTGDILGEQASQTLDNLYAYNDLLEGKRFYEKQAENLGDYFLNSLFADIDSLVLYGGIHMEVFGFHRLLSKRFPFAIYYKMDDECEITVWRVLDCRQNPEKTKSQLG